MHIRLPKNRCIAIAGDSRGARFRCEHGIVWITQAGDPNDYFLLPGEVFTVERKGTVIVEARRDASLALPDAIVPGPVT